MSGSPQITFYSCLVLLTKTRHTFRHSFYHQILVLARQRLVLVTEKRFVDDYFSSSSSLTKLTLTRSHSQQLFFKGVLLCFFTFSQCVECMFGHKTIYKVTNLKVHSKGRYFVFKKSLFKNYNERLVWTTKLFSCICDITNCKSRLRKFEWLAGGENTWLSSAISDGNQLFSVIFISSCI